MTEPTRSDDLEYRPVWAREAARKRERGREPSFKGLVLNLISLAIVVAVAAFFAAPAVAFYGIRAAAEAKDVAGLSRLIDFDAVRGSLRPQLSSRPVIQAPPPSFIQDPIGAVRRQFEQATAQAAPGAPPVDEYLTPDALLALTQGAGRAASTVTATDQGRAPTPRPVYWSVNRARLAVGEGPGGRTVFTFERRGPYEWKLVHVGLPAAS